MSNIKIIIVDYGLGNIFSIQRAINHLGADSQITDNHITIKNADRIILPGVGAFGDGMKELRKKKLDKLLVECAQTGKPILGICLGMQLLMESSEEFGCHEGLNIIPGRVVRFPDSVPNGEKYKIPHVGWSRIYPHISVQKWKNTILAGNTPGEYHYFVHSYRTVPKNEKNILAVTEYGKTKFCSVVRDKNVFGCQFHPELSGEAGLNIYKEFISGNLNA